MSFKRKGEQGYIGFMKSFNLLVSFVLFVIAAVIFIIGEHELNDRVIIHGV